ncbi:recombinase family protein [Tenacibaculum xiamenense]|uniref:recombinase family protein n=1 Tax=Tenacibaculum xiamenense TaxID=1261553 RepID=UPI003894B440
MKYIAYIRKSTEGNNRQVQSIPKQYHWVKREAERRGIRISLFFEDSKSGHKLGRKGFENMIQEIEKSKVPIGIITWKISRLSRNPIDEGIIKYAFMRGKIKHIIARDREYKEGESQIIMGVDFGQATQYSINLSKDVKEGLYKKVEKGFMPNRAPYGYINDSFGEKGNRKIYPDSKYFKPIQRFLKEYLKGTCSVPELQRKMTHEWGLKSKNGKPFALGTLYKLLENRFYCGEFVYNGKIRQGKHKPMISVDEFEKIQSLLGKSQNVSINKYENHYSGYISCGDCQSTITGYSKVKKTKKNGDTAYHYLRCTRSKKSVCNEKNIGRKYVDEQFVELLESIQISRKITTYLITAFHIKNKEEKKDLDYKKRKLQQKSSELQNELEILAEKLSKGIIKDDLFIKMSTKIEEEQSLLIKEINSIYSGNDLKKIDKFFSFLAKAKEKFVKGTHLEKKEVLKTVGANFSLKDGKLLVDLHKPFLILQKSRKHFNLRNISSELDYSSSKKGLTANFSSEFNIWCRDVEKLRTFILDKSFILP